LLISAFSLDLVTIRSMPLSESQKKLLRGLGHQLKPVIVVGNSGLSDSLLEEFRSTIDHHELIKVRVRAGDRQTRDALIDELCSKEAAQLVTRIGNVALIYRRNNENQKIPLPPN
jgi:RNA-binding protein